MNRVDVTSHNWGAYLPYDAQPCFMGFHILYRRIFLEALVSVMLCNRDWVGLTSREQVRRGMAALRGSVCDSGRRRAIRGQG